MISYLLQMPNDHLHSFFRTPSLIKSHLLKQNNNNETSPQQSPRSTPKLSLDSTTTALEAVKNGRVEEPKPAQAPAPALTQPQVRYHPVQDHLEVLQCDFSHWLVSVYTSRRKRRAPTTRPQLLSLRQSRRTTPTTKTHLRLVFNASTSCFVKIVLTSETV